MTPAILIVDDDPGTVRLYKFLLTNSGYAAVIAYDGVEALQKIEQQPFDMLITDMNMPRMSGIDLIRTLRKQNNTIHIIMVTAFGTPDTEKHAFRIGANDYIAKPFDFERLEQRVRKYFAGMETRGALDLARAPKPTSPEGAKPAPAALPQQPSGQPRPAFAAQPAQPVSLRVSLERVVKHKDLAALVLCLVDSPTSLESLWNNGDLTLQDAQAVHRVHSNALIAVFPAHGVERRLDDVLEAFYDRVGGRFPRALLVPGIARGPYTDMSACLLALARDLQARRRSQSIRTPCEDQIIGLDEHRNAFQQQLDGLLTTWNTQAATTTRSDPGERIREQQIESFIAIVDHDLGSGLQNLKQTLQIMVADQLLNQSVQHEFERLLTLCGTWKRSLIELGAGATPDCTEMDIGAFVPSLVEQFASLVAPALDVRSLPLPKLPAKADRQLLAVACLQAVHSAAVSGATHLSIVGERDPRDNGGIIRLRDNGNWRRRTELAGQSFSLSSLSSADELVIAFGLMQRAIGRQSGRLSAYAPVSGFEVSWHLPGLHAAELLSIAELQAAIKATQRELAALPKGAANAQPLTIVVNEDVSRQILLVGVVQLERQLNILSQKAQILLTQHGPTRESVKRFAGLALYCKLLVRNLSLALRDQPLPVEQIDLNQQIWEVLSLITHKTQHLKVSFRPREPLPRVALSPVEAKQILLNLIKNASEAVRGNGQLKISTTVAGKQVVVRIADSGAGIAPTHGAQIFALNFSTKGSGSGVGLYAVRTIVERANGTIAVASAQRGDDGKLQTWHYGALQAPVRWQASGACFEVTLPVSA